MAECRTPFSHGSAELVSGGLAFLTRGSPSGVFCGCKVRTYKTRFELCNLFVCLRRH